MAPVPSLAQGRRKLKTIPILPFLPPVWVPGVWNAMALETSGRFCGLVAPDPVFSSISRQMPIMQSKENVLSWPLTVANRKPFY